MLCRLSAFNRSRDRCFILSIFSSSMLTLSSSFVNSSRRSYFILTVLFVACRTYIAVDLLTRLILLYSSTYYPYSACSLLWFINCIGPEGRGDVCLHSWCSCPRLPEPSALLPDPLILPLLEACLSASSPSTPKKPLSSIFFYVMLFPKLKDALILDWNAL